MYTAGIHIINVDIHQCPAASQQEPYHHISIQLTISHPFPYSIIDANIAPARAQVAHVLEDIIRREPERWKYWLENFGTLSVPPMNPLSATIATPMMTPSNTSPCIDTILFDLDDTLVPVMGPILEANTKLHSLMKDKMPLTYKMLIEAYGSSSESDSPSTSTYNELNTHISKKIPPQGDDIKHSDGGLPVYFRGDDLGMVSEALLASGTELLATSTSDNQDTTTTTTTSTAISNENIVNLAKLLRERTKELSASNPLLSHDLTALRFTLLSDLAHESEKEHLPHIIEQFVIWRSQVGSHVYDDVIPGLEWLQARGVRLGILTNGNADVRYCSIISKYFDEELMMNAGHIGALKPSPVSFIPLIQRRHILATSKSSRSSSSSSGSGPSCVGNILFIGDNYDADVLGPMKVGMQAAWLNRKGDVLEREISSDTVIHLTSLHPTELEKKLNALLI